MIHFSKKIGLLMFLSFALLSSCSDYDDDTVSLNNEYNDLNGKNGYNTWGFMSVTGSQFYIKTDTKKTLRLKDFDNSVIQAKQGDRIYARFSIVNEEKAFATGATYNYSVMIRDLFVVDYDSITKITAENSNMIADGFVDIKGIGITANNLNIEVVYYKSSNKSHDIKLCYDESLQTAGKPLFLDLKDSSAEDIGMQQSFKKLQSYDITKLEKLVSKDSEGKIEFIVVINRGTGNEKFFNLVYKP